MKAGNREAESALFAAVYDRLHAIARMCLRNEPQGRSLGPTGLLHEAYLRFAKASITLNDSAHFRAFIARVMRRLLVDRARARKAAKRDLTFRPSDYHDLVQTEKDADEILAVDRAMEQLAREHPDEARIVELRWFAGYSEDECAAILSISVRTVRRRWRLARTRLKVLIDGNGPEVSH